MRFERSKLVAIVFVVVLLVQPVGHVYGYSATTGAESGEGDLVPSIGDSFVTELSPFAAGDTEKTRETSAPDRPGTSAARSTSSTTTPNGGYDSDDENDTETDSTDGTTTASPKTPDPDSPDADNSSESSTGSGDDETNTAGTTDSTSGSDSVGTTSTTSDSDRPVRFLLKQGDTEVIVTPLTGDDSIVEFYDYYNAKAHTNNGLEEADRTLTFLWRGPDGTVSFVTIHDKGDDSGGAVSFEFEGLPTNEGSWVVQDDSGDFTSQTQADWTWADPKTDGGAFTGGLDDDVSITIHPAFNGQAAKEPLDPGRIESWQFLSGNLSSPQRTSLSMNESVTITAINSTPVADFTTVTESPQTNQLTRFEATESFAPNATSDDYQWSFGDGTTATGREVAHRYATAGNYTVTLTIDSNSGRSTITRTVNVTNRTVSGVAITDVEVSPRGPALEGFPLPKNVSVEVAAESDVEEVRFVIAGETYVDDTGGDGWTLSYDAGRLNRTRTVAITAVTANGSTATETVQFGVVDSPEWLRSLRELLGSTYEDGTLTIGGAFPAEPANLDATPPEPIPVVGGRETTLEDTQLVFEVEYDPNERTASLGGGTNTEGEILGKTLVTTFRVGGTASADPFTLQSGELEVALEVEVPVYQTPLGIPKVGEVNVEVNVIPSGGADATFSSQGGTLRSDAELELGIEAGPTASVESGPFSAEVTGLAGVNGNATVLPSVGEFDGTATGEVTASVSGLVFEREFTFDVSEPIASPLGTAEPTGEGWNVVEKRGEKPFASSVSDTGRITTADAEFVPEAVKTSATQANHRVTSDRVADSAPVVTTYGDKTALVWERQPPSKPVEAGHEIYWSNRSSGSTWTDPTQLTDDDRFDLNPSVAGGDGTPLTVAWTRTTANLSDPAYSAPSDAFPTMEIAVKSRQNGTWSDTRLLTSDSTMDFDVHIVSSGDARVVVWQRDLDANLTTTDDREVWYAFLGNEEVSPRQLSEGRDPALVSAGDGSARVAYVTDSSSGDAEDVVIERVSTAGQTTERTYTTESVTDVAVSRTTVAWATAPTVNRSSRVVSARYNSSGWSPSGTVAFPNATVGVRELSLLDRPDRESSVLTFRGIDSETETRVVRYRLRADGEWLPSKPLLASDELDVIFSETDSTGDTSGFTTAAVGKNISTDQKADLFTVTHSYAADIESSGTLVTDGVSVGNDTRLNYTVRNTGDLPVTDEFTVVVSNGTAVVNETTYDGLSVGASRTETLSVTVDSSGTFSVDVRAPNTTEITTANNEVELVAKRTDVTVAAIDQSRNGTNVTLDATLANPSGVDARNVGYVVTSGESTIATGTLDRLNATSSRVVTTTVAAADINRTRSVRVVVDPRNTTAESNETNNRRSKRVLLPDVAVLTDATTVYNTTYGTYVSVLVENRETGEANVTIGVSPTGGNTTAARLTAEERLGTRSVTVSGRQQVNGSTYRRVAVPLVGVEPNQSIEIVATTDRPDLDVSNNVGTINATFESRQVTADLTFSFTPGEPVAGTPVSLGTSTTLPDVLVREVAWDLDDDGRSERLGERINTSFDEKGTTNVTTTITTVNGRQIDSTRTIVVRPTSESIIGEVDTIVAGQPNASEWRSVTFDERYSDPVVLMGPPSENGSDPTHVRVRNVTATGFEFQLEEWQYLDGSHAAERISYVVMEAGNYTLDSGVRVVAGRIQANESFRNVTYNTSFDSNPVVLSQTQTVREAQPVVTRQQNGTVGGFAVRLQEEEAADGNHTAEQVGYIAMTPSIGSNYGLPFEAAHTSVVVEEFDYQIDYAREYGQPPAFLAALETTNGRDTAELRYTSLSEAGVDVRIEEEESADFETGHTDEQVGWVLFRNSDYIYTTDRSDTSDADDPNPVALPGQAPPTDPDGDGRFEDVNGNGRVDFNDIVLLLQNLDSPEITDNAAAYDFNDNDRIDYDDVVTLFGDL